MLTMTILEELVDDEVAATRTRRELWERTWDADLTLRKLLHRVEDPDFVSAIDRPTAVDAAPVRINVDLPTRPSGLDEPLLELQAMDWAAQMIERVKADIVAECRRRGRSWAHIGEALGVARQSAWMKYAALEDD
ncbi:MAG: hypothetical protein QOD30_18 [Actinomycetota bacterium]|jgi:hypothetical protein|nr:hypothetical protein [Actinomycetota bacterium]